MWKILDLRPIEPYYVLFLKARKIFNILLLSKQFKYNSYLGINVLSICLEYIYCIYVFKQFYFLVLLSERPFKCCAYVLIWLPRWIEESVLIDFSHVLLLKKQKMSCKKGETSRSEATKIYDFEEDLNRDDFKLLNLNKF